MKIDNEQQRIQMMELLNTANVQQDSGSDLSGEVQQQDEYIAAQQLTGPIPCENYSDIFKYMDNNADNQEAMMPPPPKPPEETEETEETEATDETKVTELSETEQSALASASTVLQSLSDALRANPDTIISKMEELGMTPEDLLDSDNIATLANELNADAQETGLPTVDNLDSVISELQSSAENEVEKIKENLELSDQDFEELMEQIKAFFTEQAQKEAASGNITEQAVQDQAVSL